MPESRVKEVLPGAASEVLETMFFTSPMGEADPEAPPPAATVGARLVFTGGPAGEFGVIVAEAAARTIAANFIGVEDEKELTAGRIEDVILELANMICGVILGRLAPDAILEIHHPELLPDRAAVPESAESWSCDLETGICTSFLILHQ